MINSITGESDKEGYLLFFDALEGNCSIYSSRSTSSGNKTSVVTDDHIKSGNRNTDIPGADATAKSNVKPKIFFSELSTAELLLLCQQSIAEAEIKFAGTRMNNEGTNSESRNCSSSSGGSGSYSDVNLPIDTARYKSIPKVGDTSVGETLQGSTKTRNGNSQLYFGNAPSSSDRRQKSMKQRGKGVIILVQLVTSTFRHLSLPRSKIASVMLLVRLSLICCDDEVVLKRVLPCLLVALSDPSSPVRAIAIRALTAVITSVQSISSFESNFFQQYLFAPLSAVARDMEIPVRLAFSECLGSLAETARRFLERSHLLALTRAASDTRAAAAAAAAALHKRNHSKSNSDCPVSSLSVPEVLFTDCHVQFPYDSKVRSLHDQVIRWIRDVSSAPYLSAHTQKGDRDFPKPLHGSLTSSTGSSIVKRALLEDIGRLCIFFGQEATTDLLLTQILTFLNDQVSIYSCTEHVILPFHYYYLSY